MGLLRLENLAGWRDGGGTGGRDRAGGALRAGQRRAGELDTEGSLPSRGEAPAAPAHPQA